MSKLNLGERYDNADVYITCRCTTHRSGFTHHASVIMPNGETISGRACWCNRTWEAYPYDTAKRNLCDEIAKAVFNITDNRSFYKAKKNEAARAYAASLASQLTHY